MTIKEAINVQNWLKNNHYLFANTFEDVQESTDMAIKALDQQSKIGYCKDCKWWKDNDGVYRRGIGSESKCPINHKKVYEGNGYCFMYKPQENEDNV